MSPLGYIVWYPLQMIVLFGIAVAGIFTGKKLRQNKDAKEGQAGKNS